jgi:hypothetical protein
MSLMNGLDSEEYLGSVYGMDKLVYAIIVGIDALRDGNRVRYTRPGTIFFGQAHNAQANERVLEVQAALEKAAIPSEIPLDMIRMLWWKFMINVGVNQASAVMRAPFGVFQKSTEARALMRALMMEVVALADCVGVDLGEKDIADWHAYLDTLSPSGKTSMLQDIEAGRKTEVEVFGGKVVELGRSFDVPTPVNETMLHVIRVLEQYPTPASQESWVGAAVDDQGSTMIAETGAPCVADRSIRYREGGLRHHRQRGWLIVVGMSSSFATRASYQWRQRRDHGIRSGIGAKGSWHTCTHPWFCREEDVWRSGLHAAREHGLWRQRGRSHRASRTRWLR